MKAHVVERDHGWNAVMAKAKELSAIKAARVKVGVLASGKGSAKEGKLTVAELAAVLHFGTRDGRIPARPFLAMAFDAKRQELTKLGSELLAAVIFGQTTLGHALDIMGATLASAAKATIVAGVPPPNAPSTALRKALKGKGVAASMRAARNAAQRAEEGSGRPSAALAKTQAASAKLSASLAGVKPLIDRGRLLNSITWAQLTDGSERE